MYAQELWDMHNTLMFSRQPEYLAPLQFQAPESALPVLICLMVEPLQSQRCIT